MLKDLLNTLDLDLADPTNLEDLVDNHIVVTILDLASHCPSLVMVSMGLPVVSD